MLSFKPTFSLSSFTFIKRLFSSSSLSAIRVVSTAYLRLLIFLPAVLIPACASSSRAFLMMYSEYKLSRVTIYSLDVLLSQFGTSPLFHIQFCYFLNCIQVSQETGKVVWYSELLKKFPVCCDAHSQRPLHSQWSRSRCFSRILLLSLRSNDFWQFDLWFLCLF